MSWTLVTPCMREIIPGERLGSCAVPPVSDWPFCTVSRLVPSAEISASSPAWEEDDRPRTATIAATPIAMPSADKLARSLRVRSPTADSRARSAGRSRAADGATVLMTSPPDPGSSTATAATVAGCSARPRRPRPRGDAGSSGAPAGGAGSAPGAAAAAGSGGVSPPEPAAGGLSCGTPACGTPACGAAAGRAPRGGAGGAAVSVMTRPSSISMRRRIRAATAAS